MKNCILFATYIPDVSNIPIGLQFLNYFNDHFSDYDIYVGVNPSCDEWKQTLSNYAEHVNINYEDVPKNRVIDSDASAFQTCLKLLKDSGNKYDTVWYVHTKGVTSGLHTFRDTLFSTFLSKRKDIEEMFNTDSNLGAYYPFTGFCGSDTYIDNALNHVLKVKLNDNVRNISSLYTFYVHRGECVDFFLKNHTDDFFEKKILELKISEQNYYQDRYFFERDFSMLPLKMGYRVHKDNKIN